MSNNIAFNCPCCDTPQRLDRIRSEWSDLGAEDGEVIEIDCLKCKSPMRVRVSVSVDFMGVREAKP